MAINDLVSDALTRVRNAGMRRLPVTTLVHSKSVEAVANMLKESLSIVSMARPDLIKKSAPICLVWH